MPSVSQAQQMAMAIAEHAPNKLYKRNAGLKKMSHKDLHDFAATPRKGLAKHIGDSRRAAARRVPGGRDSDSDYV